jgi:hypothetical protein
MTLDDVRAAWAPGYDVGEVAGRFWAMRLIGGQPLEADTPEKLDSAIRADLARQGAA